MRYRARPLAYRPAAPHAGPSVTPPEATEQADADELRPAEVALASGAVALPAEGDPDDPSRSSKASGSRGATFLPGRPGRGRPVPNGPPRGGPARGRPDRRCLAAGGSHGGRPAGSNPGGRGPRRGRPLSRASRSGAAVGDRLA